MKNDITRLRKDRGMTQDELGKILHVSRQTIVAIEKGHFNPSLPLALRLAREFSKNVEEIFFLDEGLPGRPLE